MEATWNDHGLVHGIETEWTVFSILQAVDSRLGKILCRLRGIGSILCELFDKFVNVNGLSLVLWFRLIVATVVSKD